MGVHAHDISIHQANNYDDNTEIMPTPSVTTAGAAPLAIAKLSSGTVQPTAHHCAYIFNTILVGGKAVHSHATVISSA